MPPEGTPHVRQRREVLAYANRFVSVFDDEVEFTDGTPGRYVRIVSAGPGRGVVIVPVCGNSVALVQTYRYPVGAWQWGLPRGFPQHPDPEITARAELSEELGLQAAELRELGVLTPDSGLLASRVVVMYARIGSAQSLRPQDTREIAAARWVPVTQLWAMAGRGELQDGMTLAALALAQAGRVLTIH